MEPEEVRKPADLVRAYEATAYTVECSGRALMIRVGQVCADLDELLRERGIATWAFVSAANPGSIRLSPAENEERHRLLLMHLEQEGVGWLPGSGEPDGPGWEAEPSALVFGIDPDTAIALGRRFGQKAIVFGSIGQPASLVWC